MANVRRSRRIFWAVTTAMVLGVAAFGAAAVLSGNYQVRPVLSGSMRPGLPVGGVVVTERVPVSSLHVRDVVVFHRPDVPADLVVHRIVSLRKTSQGVVIRTQGDANNAKDPWTVTLRGSTAYRAVWSLPLVGYVAVWAHNPDGRRTLLVIGLLLVFYVFAMTALRRRPTGSHRAPPEESVDDADEDRADDLPALV